MKATDAKRLDRQNAKRAARRQPAVDKYAGRASEDALTALAEQYSPEWTNAGQPPRRAAAAISPQPAKVERRLT